MITGKSRRLFSLIAGDEDIKIHAINITSLPTPGLLEADRLDIELDDSTAHTELKRGEDRLHLAGRVKACL